jgi:hypothetical protein
MAVLPNGEFLDAIWNPSNPSEAIFYRASMGESWANLTWKLAIGANRGTIAFDDYKEIVFDGVK